MTRGRSRQTTHSDWSSSSTSLPLSTTAARMDNATGGVSLDMNQVRTDLCICLAARLRCLRLTGVELEHQSKELRACRQSGLPHRTDAPVWARRNRIDPSQLGVD